MVNLSPAAGASFRHADTFLTLAETAAERRFDMPFLKTYDYAGEYLNHYHRSLVAKLDSTGMIDIGIAGWLLPQDALKLYELAYFCAGDILELGAYRGLSAFVMNAASNDSGQDNTIVSVDLDHVAVEQSRALLHTAPGGKRAWFFQDDATTAVKNLAAAKRQFQFAFVDHSHRYDHVFDVCQHLHRVVKLGGFALFHDFNDPRNGVETAVDYGVYQGAMDGLRPDRWEFWGIYGCTGLFRRIGPC
jgi:predicted O-methyltransferase YrrM